MPDKEDVVRLLLRLLRLLLLDPELVDRLDLDVLPDSAPDRDVELAREPADLGLLFVLEVRPVLEVRVDLEEISDTSDCLEEISEMEESLVLEVRSDKAVVDLLRALEVFFSTSGSALTATTLK
uniref:Uncharacterized protein n=1 Tax=Knipowitschia caucasica TaxID=637954 RepID=A0AAV2L7V6_KNICA